MGLASMETYLDLVKFLGLQKVKYIYSQNAQKEDIFRFSINNKMIEVIVHEYYLSLEIKDFLTNQEIMHRDYFLDKMNSHNTNWLFATSEWGIGAKRVFGLIGCTIEEIFLAFSDEYEGLNRYATRLKNEFLPIIA